MINRSFSSLVLVTGLVAVVTTVAGGAEIAPARALYESAVFAFCGPFADYRPSEDNCFMTLELDAPATRP